MRLTLILLLLSSLAFGQSTATYDITFTSIWNAGDHTSLPPNAHWSKLVGATHKTANAFFEVGTSASTGIKDMAERGVNTDLESEVNTEISNLEANQYIDGPNLSTATGNMVISDLVVSEDYPLLTLVSMIAPSPDWFIGVNSYDLQPGGNWVTSVTFDVFAYDAGTDDGTNYTSANAITSPFENISMINGTPINGNKMGTMTITLKTVASIDEVGTSNINIYPNPVEDGKVKITSSNEEDVKLTIYSSVGNNMGHHFHSGFSSEINVSDFPPGIYFLREEISGHIHKVIIL